MYDGVLTVKKGRLKISQSLRIQISLAKTQRRFFQELIEDHWYITFNVDQNVNGFGTGEVDENNTIEPIVRLPKNCKLKYIAIDRKLKKIEITGVIYENY